MPSNAGNPAGSCAIGVSVDREGTLSCGHAAALCKPDAATRDLADAVHALCQLHGSAPSIVRLAAQSDSADSVRSWLEQAAAAFDQERADLAVLTAAVGPRPSTPRHTQAEAAINSQRLALATLAQSTRAGCAGGAALAFLLDWHAIRPVLGSAAQRSGVALSQVELPSRAAIIAVADRVSATPSHARALAFGSEQMALQHRGFWQLLAARAEARAAL